MAFSSEQPVQNKWKFLFSLWMLHGVIALWQLISLSSDNRNFLFGLSFQQISMGLLLFWIIFNLFLIIAISRKSLWLVQLTGLLKNPTLIDGVFAVATLVVFLRICLAILRTLTDRTVNFRLIAYADRLSPLLDLMTFVFIEIIALNLFFVFHNRQEYKNLYKALSKRIMIVLAVLAIVVLYISLTDMGIKPVYNGDWARGMPAVPLLEWQILLACLFCVGMVIVESNEKILDTPRLDLWISLAIWGATVTLWLGQPIVLNASALEPHKPNFEIYPFIDAQVYDKFSQSVLIGNGFGLNEIPQRPLYVVFLVFLHVLVGQDYGNMIMVQSLFFAMFPVMLYFFGREFFGRPVGISIALLAVLRDYTSNLVSPFAGNLSYSKVYLSELPTAIFLIFFLLVGMRWIKSGLPAFLGFLLGGILGIAMLIRTQVVVALPVIIIFALLVQPRVFKPLIRSVLLMVLGIALVVSPWLWRNWRLTGAIIFDNPASQTINLALRYSRLNGVEPDVLPFAGETNLAYNDRLKKTALDAISENPKGAFLGVVNSFLNHSVNNILLFPLRNDIKDFSELWTPNNAFWERWEGRPNLSQGVLLGFYVSLFGLGLTAAWQRNGWLGFLPLVLNLAYNLWTSLALLSGQRFMLTMDWSIYLYYMIGLFALLSFFMFALENSRSIILTWYEANAFSYPLRIGNTKWRYYIFAGLVFFGVGASLPLSEIAFPKRYPPIAQDEVLKNVYLSSAIGQANLEIACFKKMIDKNGLKVVRGRAIYPRYYEAGDGEVFTDAVGYKIVDEGRLVFEMVGQGNNRVIFPMSEQPDFFPNASDITLWINGTNAPWFVFIEHGDSQRFYISDMVDLSSCD